MDIGEGTVISRKTHLDTNVYPKGLHIGKNTRVTGSVIILTHDACRKLKADTYIGDNCFIGSRSTILPGVHIGNQVIIGIGSVVTKDIPDNCIAAGNPAKVIRTGVKCGRFGVIESE
ncbi:MAG: acyltransferase [Bacteroidales bacterium]|nr:acyltransferase [Bacteroidales bacterium]